MFRVEDIVICIDPAHGLKMNRQYKVTNVEDSFIDIYDMITGEEYDGIFKRRFKLKKKGNYNRYA